MLLHVVMSMCVCVCVYMSAGLCDLHPGQDYVSNENGEGVSVSGVAECCDRCLLKTDCVAFAFYSSGLCFLKHQIGQLMPNPMMTAGIMLRNGKHKIHID